MITRAGTDLSGPKFCVHFRIWDTGKLPLPISDDLWESLKCLSDLATFPNFVYQGCFDTQVTIAVPRSGQDFDPYVGVRVGEARCALCSHWGSESG